MVKSKSKYKTIINIGCGLSNVKLNHIKEIRLDIDKRVNPDIILDARYLKTLKPNQYDGAWCSHVIEHFYEYEVPMILNGIFHVLKKEGVLFLMVPDLGELFLQVIQKGLNLNQTIYMSGMGPVRPRDMLYGFQTQVATGNVFYSHKTGFDSNAIEESLYLAGFKNVFIKRSNLEIDAIACKNRIPNWIKTYVKS